MVQEQLRRKLHGDPDTKTKGDAKPAKKKEPTPPPPTDDVKPDELETVDPETDENTSEE